MSFVKFDTTTQNKAFDQSIIPLKDGQFLIVIDKGKIIYDYKNKRIALEDIVDLDTEIERENLENPLDKFYYVKESNTLWRYNSEVWNCWKANGMSGMSSMAVYCNISASNWSAGRNIINVNGLKADTNGVVGLAQNISTAALESVKSAELYVCGQSNGTLTISANGDIPKEDIPIVIILLG